MAPPPSPGAGPQASVTGLVCTKDRSELLGAALRSLAAALRPQDELVVVEHGASGAAAILEELACRSVLVTARRAGKSRQLNEGVLAAGSEVIVCTDDDCRVPPGWVSAMAAPFADPAVGIVFGPVDGLSGVAGTVGPRRLEPGPAPSVTWHYANGAAMAVRRSMVVEIGGFDERLGPGAPQHGEEHDLVLRAQEAGWQVRIAAVPPVEHVGWRDRVAERHNLSVYSRGAGAFIGAALRRAPRRHLGLLVRRARYQARLWRFWRVEGPWFGPRTTLSFLGGLVAGLRLEPRRWMSPG